MQMQKYFKSHDKGKPRVFEVSSVSEFIEVATWLYSDDRMIFRGQTKEEGWPLSPSVGRNPDSSRIPWREIEILEEFKRESIPYIDLSPQNNWQWLALAQHNRLPTRLLDWTKNPLAALWFAVKEPAIDHQPGVVWAFHYADEEAVFNTDKQESPFSIDRTYVYFPEHVYPFIQAQSGVFTVHHREGDNPGRFSPLEESTSDSDLLLTKIEIPILTTVRYHLFKVGISPASLFPGLPGIVDKILYDNMPVTDEGNA
jgi:FRG domain